MNILLVEDEPFMLEAMSNVIEGTGFKVLKTDNAKDAKQILEKENINMVITDLYLPEPDGFELVKFIKTNSQTKHIPVLVVTGLVEHRETLADKVMADEWIAKPFTLDELLRSIKKFAGLNV